MKLKHLTILLLLVGCSAKGNREIIEPKKSEVKSVVVETPIVTNSKPKVQVVVKPILNVTQVTTHAVGTWGRDRACLWTIAGRKDIYGDNARWPEIYQANKHQIKNPDLIYPGQVLIIPR